MKEKMFALFKSALIVLFFFAAQFFGAFVAVFIQSIIKVMTAMQNGEEITEKTVESITDSLGNLSMVTMVVEFFVIIIFYIIVRNRSTNYKAHSITLDKILMYGLFGAVMNFLITFILYGISYIIPISVSTADIIFSNNDYNPVFVLIVVGIMTPISEEIIFRYGVQGYLSKAFNKTAVPLQGIIFGLVHSQFGSDITVTESGSINIVKTSSISGFINAQVIYALILGIILGFIYEKTKDLTSVIIMHAVINSISVLATYCVHGELIVVTAALMFSVLMAMLAPAVRKSLRNRSCIV